MTGFYHERMAGPDTAAMVEPAREPVSGTTSLDYPEKGRELCQASPLL
jgi:hypothetical protein